MRRHVLIAMGLTLGIAALGSTSASACDWDNCGNGCGSYGYYAAPVYYARPAYAYYAPPVYYAAPTYYAAPAYTYYAPPVYAPPVYAPPVYAPPVYSPPPYGYQQPSFRGHYYGGQWAANFDRRNGLVAAGKPTRQGVYAYVGNNGPGGNKTSAANPGIQVRPTSVANHLRAVSNDTTANTDGRVGYVPTAYYGSRR